MLSTDEGRQSYMHPIVKSMAPSALNQPASAHRRVSPSPERMDPQNLQHIWIVTGPAGCGKTTVAKSLAEQLSLPYIEGDDYHSQSNRDKMAQNIPLTDADRWDWLILLREAAIANLTANAAEGSPPYGVVVTCSALKHKYRDVIRVAAYDHPSIHVHFIYLKADEAVLLKRVMSRQGHYMKSSMVHSQFENLEEPDAEWDTLAIDCMASPEEVKEQALEAVRMKLAEYEQ